ncbi:MAG TPA: TIGR03086 family metal-binding protein [Nocardioides sp.]|nr:TIGR03086 family metal-binding protein [Nocardioides sp.]
MSAADEHREIAAGFTARVRGTADWDAAAPVAGWTARDVVRHLVTWSREFLASRGLAELPPVPSVDDDPVGAWAGHTEGMQALLESPAAGEVVDDPHLGTQSLGELIAQIYLGDVFLHTWDLARATGQDERLDPDRCAAMLAGMEPIEDVMRGSGHYGPRVEVPPDADVQTRLIGFIGRDPGWRPPAGG